MSADSTGRALPRFPQLMLGGGAVGLGFFFYFGSVGILLPYLTPVLIALGYTSQQCGIFHAVSSLCTTIAPVWGGRLADRRVAADRLLRGCAFLCSAAFLMAGWRAQANGLLFIALLTLAALARGPMVAMLDTLATLRLQPGRAGAATYGRIRLLGSVGFIVGSIGAGIALGADTTNRFFALVAALFASLGIATFAMPRATPQRHTGTQAIDKRSFWQQLDARFLLWLAAMFLHWFSFAPYHYGLTLYLNTLEVPSEITGVVWAMGVASELVFFMLAGWIYERLGVRWMLWLALGCTALRWSIVGVWPGLSTLLWTQPLHGPGFALFYGGAVYALRQRSDETNLASYQGLFATTVVGLGTSLGMLLSGALYAHLTFPQMLLCMVPVQLVGLVLFGIVARRGTRDTPLI